MLLAAALTYHRGRASMHLPIVLWFIKSHQYSLMDKYCMLYMITKEQAVAEPRW